MPRLTALTTYALLWFAVGVFAESIAWGQQNPLRPVTAFESEAFQELTEEPPDADPPPRAGERRREPSGGRTNAPELLDTPPGIPRTLPADDPWPSDTSDDWDWQDDQLVYEAALAMNGLYVRAEWLLWNSSGLDLPPLVTTSPAGTARANAGVLGLNTTTILFGGESVNDSTRSGGRITFGTWLSPDRRVALEGEYFALGDEHANFSATSTGPTILGRPFFNMLTGRETAELIGFPNLISGTVDVEAITQFQGAAARIVYPLCSGYGCVYPMGDEFGRGVPQGYQFNVTGGYRFLRLDDSVVVREDLTSLNPAAPGTFLIEDRFVTSNQFHGAEIGMLLQCRRGRWSLEGITKVAVGNNRGNVQIRGASTITENNIAEQFNTGILAQRSNIGQYTQDQFAMVPELGLTVGLQVAPNWRVVAGYSLIYWSRVLRAGDQIDRDLNPNLIAPETVPFTGPLRPQFAFQYTDFWAQGFNLGLEGRW
jgi:hypothetical protein